MTDNLALEIDVEELLRRDPLSVSDVLELRREVYRTQERREAFLRLLNEKFPAGSRSDQNAMRRAIGLWAAGKIADASPTLENSRDPLASYLLGVSALDGDDALRAKKFLEPISSGKNALVEFRVALAEVYARLDDRDALAGLVSAISQSDPRSADAAYVTGRQQELDGEYAAALASFERALSLNPDHRLARFRLAYRLDLLGRDAEAIQHYERLKQVFPVPVGVLVNLGLLYEDAGNYDRATGCYRLVLAHDYNHPLGRMYHIDARASVEMFYDEEKERKDDKRAQILKIPVTDFELSVRSRNCLARMNIRSLGDLIRKSEAELLSFKNFGETSLNEIKEILRSKGLRLGMHTDDDDRRGPPRRRSDVDRDAVRAKPIADLDLSVRSRRALETLKVGTIGQLCDLSEDALLACKNFGQTSLLEIKKKLADLELSLRS
jgi:DNA-directed RNA polymerase subunit alpha